MDSNVINEEENESSRNTIEQNESGIPVVIEDSKIEYSEPSTAINITEPSIAPELYQTVDPKPLPLSDDNYDSRLSLEFNIFLYTKFQHDLEQAEIISK